MENGVPDSFPTPDSACSLTARLPRKTRLFAGSSYPLPLCQAVLGRIPSPEEIRVRIAASDSADAGRYALDIALAAEMYEASCPDAAEAFVSDTALRGFVFSGGKWRAGWSVLLGSRAGELKEELERREFIVFESRRPTWPAYWLQMLARYAMIWGQVPPGFPFSEGRQVIAEDEDDILEALVTLPNLRVKEVGGERVALPAWCNPAHAREPFDAARTLGGNGLSFLSLRAGRAQAPVAVVGSPGGLVGVLVEVDDDRLEPDVAEYLERAARWRATNSAKSFPRGDASIPSAESTKASMKRPAASLRESSSASSCTASATSRTAHAGASTTWRSASKGWEWESCSGASRERRPTERPGMAWPTVRAASRPTVCPA
jgi:hypothetical protein